MTTIDPDQKICTLINVFTVDPEKNEELFELLKTATEEVISKQPGYISANLHISDDKKTITNYAQWRSLEDFHNMIKHPAALIHMVKAAAMAKDFKPVTYGEIWSHHV
ncbi:MAG: antibiotic biosynthesis monooxygenase [Bacteroidetes bacterium]|nr:antibiotic biosynthesis monooxygenase [Bacteroidota bacterium]